MGRLRADVMGFDGAGERFRFGSILTDGDRVMFQAEDGEGHEEMLRIMSTEPIMVEKGEAVYPEDEPERFVRKLELAYRGSRVWATPAVAF